MGTTSKRSRSSGCGLRIIADSVLKFHKTSTEEERPYSIITLRNPDRTNQLIAFKIKSSRPQHYYIQSKHGFLSPGETKKVMVIFTGLKTRSVNNNNTNPSSESLTDKFLVQICAISNNLRDSAYDDSRSKFTKVWKQAIAGGKIYKKKFVVEHVIDDDLPPSMVTTTATISGRYYDDDFGYGDYDQRDDDNNYDNYDMQRQIEQTTEFQKRQEQQGTAKTLENNCKAQIYQQKEEEKKSDYDKDNHDDVYDDDIDKNMFVTAASLPIFQHPQRDGMSSNSSTSSVVDVNLHDCDSNKKPSGDSKVNDYYDDENIDDDDDNCECLPPFKVIEWNWRYVVTSFDLQNSEKE